MSIVRPTFFEDNIYNIKLNTLKKLGIKLFLMDIDNTIVPYSVPQPTEKVNEWFNTVKRMGFTICLISNNKKMRVEKFNENLAFEVKYKANKPLTYNCTRIIKKLGFTKEQTVLIGDQLFTDICCASLAGIKSILLKPIAPWEESFGIKLKRILEKPIIKKITPKKLGLIGNPVEHSLSPVLHSYIYEQQGINATYRLFSPDICEIPKYIEYFKKEHFLGFNITVPYKFEIIKYLDYISDDAKRINSVNTVKIVNGKLYGYSTDGDGFTMQLENGGKDETVKIIGAGGVVPSIVNSLIKKSVKEIIIYNRTVAKAEMIANNYDNVTALPLDEFTADNCTILINATSAELITGKPPVENLNGIDINTKVFDISYKPKFTKFMALAKKEGCTYINNGLRMLINQGVIAHRIWFEGTNNK